MRVVGLDLSLTGTGLADAAGMVVEVARFGSPADDRTVAGRSRRLRHLAGRIHDRILLAGRPDLVVVESPAYSSSTGKAHDRSGLWWLVVARLTGSGVVVVEVTTQHLKMYATGRGTGVDKDDVLAAVVRRYPGVNVGKNDEADALVLAAMGRRYLGDPIEGLLPQTHLRAMTRVAWPKPIGA